jgi:hypothetical protein
VNPIHDEAPQAQLEFYQDYSVAEQVAEHGAVYLIGTMVGGLVKIGTSLDPERRLSALQTAHPRSLRILSFIPGGRAIERGLHDLFSDLRVQREWFLDKECQISSTFEELLALFRAGAIAL